MTLTDSTDLPDQPTSPLNALAREIHVVDNHRWWHDLRTGARLDRNRGELFMLMVSEVSEAMEGERKNLMDDKLPHRKMAEVELADIWIRALDFAGAHNFDLDRHIVAVGIPPMETNKAAALLQIAHELTIAGTTGAGMHWIEWRLCRVLAMIRRYATAHGYDVDAAVAEKRAFNAVRADHKAESRLAAGGKQF